MLESSRRWEWIAGESESARRVNFDPTKKFGIGPFRLPPSGEGYVSSAFYLCLCPVHIIDRTRKNSRTLMPTHGLYKTRTLPSTNEVRLMTLYPTSRTVLLITIMIIAWT